jgi:hypothetical protein
MSYADFLCANYALCTITFAEASFVASILILCLCIYDNSQRLLLALDTPLLSFARWDVVEDLPEWFLVGSKAFRSHGDNCIQLSPAYTAMRGYYAGLKTCMAGLVLVCDMSVSCFLSGGEMINMLWQAAGYRSFNDMMQEASGPRGLDPRRLKSVSDAIKNAKVKLTHLGHWKKSKCK